MGIDFSSPWWLLLMIPAAALLFWWWHRDGRWSRGKKITLTALRGLIFLLLIFALAGLQLVFPAQGQVVVFVADQSASLGETNAVEDIIRQAVAAKGPDDRFAVVSVGREAVVDQSLSAKSDVSPLSSVVSEHQTDLASGMRLAGGMIPEGVNARVVLISDGEETRGDAIEEAKQLHERGIRVDTAHVMSEIGDEVLVSGLHVPSRLFPGEEYDVRVEIESTIETEAMVRLYDGDEEVVNRPIDVHPGLNQITFSASAENTGFHRYRVELDPAHDTVVANNQGYAYSEVQGDPAVLIVEGTDRAADNMIGALEATGMRIDRVTADALPQQLESYKQYQSIILADVAAFQFGERKMELIRAAVRDLGVGLVMTGGRESFGMGGWFRTPIEEALPVYMDLRDKEKIPSLGLILVIDKSGSMDGPGSTSKMELAKEAAIRATQMLSPQDEIGVVAFDGTPWWVVEPRHVDDVQAIQEQIGTIKADGGTDIYPALVEAYDRLKGRDTQRKHIILLTDGQSGGPSQYEALIEDLVQRDITLSTVAVGTDADTGLLENMAEAAKGRYYFVTDDTTIPTIFSKEAALATRTYIVEDPFRPQWTGGRDWAEGLQGVPPLSGYIATTPKERAERVLVSGEPDPVAARWTYGLGRSVAWTSDLSGNWSSEWVDWPSFSLFINRMIQWTFPQYEQGEWAVETSQTGGKGTVTLTVADGGRLPEGDLQVTIVREDLSKESMPLKAIAPGTYEAEFAADDPGAYLLQVSETNGQDVFHTDTYGMAVPYSPEYRLPQNGAEKMEQIAAAGGGDPIISDLKQAFADVFGPRWQPQPVDLWCLLLAMLLLPIDIAARRLTISPQLLARIRGRFGRRRRSPRETVYSQTLARLNVRKTNVDREAGAWKPAGKELSYENRRPQVDGPVGPKQGIESTENSSRAGSEKEEVEPSAGSKATDRMNRLLAAKNRGRR